MTDTVERKMPEAIVVLQHPNGFRVRIDLFKLTPRALSLLSRFDTRISNDPAFYQRPISERVLIVQPRSLLEKSGSPHRPESVGGVIIAPNLGQNDRAFDLGAYGHPREPETFMRWLDGCAAAINQARADRDVVRTRVLAEVDARIDDWMKRIVAKGSSDLEVAVRFDVPDQPWDLRWNSVALAFRSAEEDGLRARLDERIRLSGKTKTEYLTNHPITAGLAARAFEHLAQIEQESEFVLRA